MEDKSTNSTTQSKRKVVQDDHLNSQSFDWSKIQSGQTIRTTITTRSIPVISQRNLVCDYCHFLIIAPQLVVNCPPDSRFFYHQKCAKSGYALRLHDRSSDDDYLVGVEEHPGPPKTAKLSYKGTDSLPKNHYYAIIKGTNIVVVAHEQYEATGRLQFLSATDMKAYISANKVYKVYQPSPNDLRIIAGVPVVETPKHTQWREKANNPKPASDDIPPVPDDFDVDLENIRPVVKQDEESESEEIVIPLGDTIREKPTEYKPKPTQKTQKFAKIIEAGKNNPPTPIRNLEELKNEPIANKEEPQQAEEKKNNGPNMNFNFYPPPPPDPKKPKIPDELGEPNKLPKRIDFAKYGSPWSDVFHKLRIYTHYFCAVLLGNKIILFILLQFLALYAKEISALYDPPEWLVTKVQYIRSFPGHDFFIAATSLFGYDYRNWEEKLYDEWSDYMMKLSSNMFVWFPEHQWTYLRQVSYLEYFLTAFVNYRYFARTTYKILTFIDEKFFNLIINYWLGSIVIYISFYILEHICKGTTTVYLERIHRIEGCVARSKKNQNQAPEPHEAAVYQLHVEMSAYGITRQLDSSEVFNDGYKDMNNNFKQFAISSFLLSELLDSSTLTTQCDLSTIQNAITRRARDCSSISFPPHHLLRDDLNIIADTVTLSFALVENNRIKNAPFRLCLDGSTSSMHTKSMMDAAKLHHLNQNPSGISWLGRIRFALSMIKSLIQYRQVLVAMWMVFVPLTLILLIQLPHFLEKSNVQHSLYLYLKTAVNSLLLMVNGGPSTTHAMSVVEMESNAELFSLISPTKLYAWVMTFSQHPWLSICYLAGHT